MASAESIALRAATSACSATVASRPFRSRPNWRQVVIRCGRNPSSFMFSHSSEPPQDPDRSWRRRTSGGVSQASQPRRPGAVPDVSREGVDQRPSGARPLPGGARAWQGSRSRRGRHPATRMRGLSDLRSPAGRVGGGSPWCACPSGPPGRSPAGPGPPVPHQTPGANDVNRACDGGLRRLPRPFSRQHTRQHPWETRLPDPDWSEDRRELAVLATRGDPLDPHRRR